MQNSSLTARAQAQQALVFFRSIDNTGPCRCKECGIAFVGIVLVIGIVWYVIKAIRNRQAGVETELMYKMLPPD